ncbi:hypothetical protein BJ546DRAFT_1054629 [Cryomyces antarcticus]
MHGDGTGAETVISRLGRAARLKARRRDGTHRRRTGTGMRGGSIMDQCRSCPRSRCVRNDGPRQSRTSDVVLCVEFRMPPVDPPCSVRHRATEPVWAFSVIIMNADPATVESSSESPENVLLFVFMFSPHGMGVPSSSRACRMTAPRTPSRGGVNKAF